MEKTSNEYQKERYAAIEEKMQSGYGYMLKNECPKGCDKWLSAWEDIKVLLAESDIKDVSDLDRMFRWSQNVFNFVQDLGEELGNAGLEDEAYYHKRIKYCCELLAYGDSDQLILENARIAIAESYGALGDYDRCDKLFEEWLQADPEWGWGYIGWADCYFQGGRGTEHYGRAKEILLGALRRSALRDRFDVIERAVWVCREAGDMEKVRELNAEFRALAVSEQQMPIQVQRVGRNEPCPCGSGKKFKKCCGA